ncbi:hypothetical protein Dimus_039671 [Dionaea muscipula]
MAYDPRSHPGLLKSFARRHRSRSHGVMLAYLLKLSSNGGSKCMYDLLMVLGDDCCVKSPHSIPPSPGIGIRRHLKSAYKAPPSQGDRVTNSSTELCQLPTFGMETKGSMGKPMVAEGVGSSSWILRYMNASP